MKSYFQANQCYICQCTQHPKRFLLVNQKEEEKIQSYDLMVCQTCAQIYHPDLIPKPPTQLWRKRKAISKIEQENEFKQSSKFFIEKIKDKEVSSLGNNQFSCEKCQKNNYIDNFLICEKCQIQVHAKCCDPLLQKKLVIRWPWQCTECKICYVCHNSREEHSLLICDCCDRAFHLNCLNPKQTEIPEQDWFCQDCNNCPSCGILFQYNFMSQHQKQMFSNQIFKGVLYCNICYLKYLDKQYCGVCNKIIQEEEDNDFIFCDFCSLWIHATCENITKKMLNEIQKQDKFKCSHCQKNQSSNYSYK